MASMDAPGQGCLQGIPGTVAVENVNSHSNNRERVQKKAIVCRMGRQ